MRPGFRVRMIENYPLSLALLVSLIVAVVLLMIRVLARLFSSGDDRRHWARLCGAVAVTMLALAARSDNAQPLAVGFSVTPLLRTMLPGDPGRDVVVALGVFAPGGTTGLHTHPGEEYATVIAGTLEVASADQPPQRYEAGKAYHNPRGLPHETRNVGSGVARVASTFIVDCGKPIVERLDRGAGEP